MVSGEMAVTGAGLVEAGVLLGAASPRKVVLASADAGLRERLRSSLAGMRWEVHEATGGAEAMARLEDVRPEALLVDSWLPDLEVGEFAVQIRALYPAVELMRMDGGIDGSARSPRRNELLHALREAQESHKNDTAAWNAAPERVPTVHASVNSVRPTSASAVLLPEMVGASVAMRELAQLIRLVAPRTTTVLIEGETGSGKRHAMVDSHPSEFRVRNTCAPRTDSSCEQQGGILLGQRGPCGAAFLSGEREEGCGQGVAA